MKVGCVGRAAPANPANIGLGRTQIMEIPIFRYRFWRLDVAMTPFPSLAVWNGRWVSELFAIENLKD
ncbi:hypothetical protein EV2_026035 [Malus domestica]